jgi:RNA polymerase sigma factor (TIGR02999 family)
MSGSEVSQLLEAWAEGDGKAQDRLIPLVYEELHRVARRAMAADRQVTLQPTALVHEAFLRLTDAAVQWNGRVHFFAVAARLMRRILVDEARRRKADKRGGGEALLPLDEALIPVERADDLLALDDALAALSQLDERKARVVELRFFAGLTIEETAAALAVSHATVERDLKLAKAWLADALKNPP